MATATQTETSSVPATFELQSQHESPRNSLHDPEPEHVSDKPSKADLLRIMSVAFSFFVAGVNDGSVGALVPHVIRDYKVTTAIVSSV